MPPYRLLALAASAVALTVVPDSSAQTFSFGNDLSYVNQMEDCGAVYKEGGVPKDPYQIFADHGSNLVRVRLWVDPSWQNDLVQPEGVKAQYSDFEDVRETIARAKGAGMEVLLDLHYSDVWTDPGRQVVPKRWQSVAYGTDALADSVYRYTRRSLEALDAEGLMPEMVQVGNETNPGMLVHSGMNARFEPTGTISGGWARQAVLFNAGIRAVREVGASASVDPKIMIHFAGPSGVQGRFQRLIDAGVTDFDVMGLSFYYSWHEMLIGQGGAVVRDLRQRFSAYDVALAETGYLWSSQNYDPLGNIITTADPAYLPVSPETQLEYQVDLTREMMRAGAAGVMFWEPAWVSTDCRTPWGQGSSHDHVAFFTPDDTDYIEHGGGEWAEARFYADPEAPKTVLKVDVGERDASAGVYVVGDVTGGEPVWTASRGDGVYRAFVYPPSGTTARFRFQIGEGPAETVPAACAASGQRTVTVGGSDAEVGFVWGSCETFGVTGGEAPVTFAVDMAGQDVSRGVYVTGHATDWEIVRMEDAGDGLYRYETTLCVGDEGAYYFVTTPTWDNYQAYREAVPAACATWYGSDRGYAVPAGGVTFAFVWGSCEAAELATSGAGGPADGFGLSAPRPNPTAGGATVRYEVPTGGPVTLTVYDALGRRVRTLLDGPVAAGPGTVRLETAGLPAGTYLVRLATAAGRADVQRVTVFR